MIQRDPAYLRELEKIKEKRGDCGNCTRVKKPGIPKTMARRAYQLPSEPSELPESPKQENPVKE